MRQVRRSAYFVLASLLPSTVALAADPPAAPAPAAAAPAPAPAAAPAAPSEGTTPPAPAATPTPPAPPTPPPAPPPPPPPPPPTEKSYWKANAQAGMIWLSGNSNSIAFSGGAVIARDDKENVLTITGRGAYSTSADSPTNDSPFAKAAAANWLASIRYDRLLGKPNDEGLRTTNLFLEARTSQDKFAGIWLRPEGSIGAGHSFVRSKVQVFRAELAFNYQHEWAAADPRPMAMPATNAVDYVSGFEKNYYGGRLGLVYENKFTPYAAFSDAAELTVSGIGEKALPTDSSWRALFTNVATLSSALSSRVTLKILNTTKVNSQPAADVKQKWDNTLEVALGITIL